jgi:hypothetical protein
MMGQSNRCFSLLRKQCTRSQAPQGCPAASSRAANVARLVAGSTASPQGGSAAQRHSSRWNNVLKRLHSESDETAHISHNP